MIGNIHSIQSLGAVDGPGVRYVVFMQGCPLRCVYCHNPDTWLTEGGTPTDVDELVRKALRFRPYWKNGGGVTVINKNNFSRVKTSYGHHAINCCR